MPNTGKESQASMLRIKNEVIRQIRQHARSSSHSEVCGILIGRESNQGVTVDACIAGANAAQGGSHVTFTQDTWEHIYKIKDRDYPEERIVGWYHSHPGFGVFLSDHDTFIHENFFSSPFQIAWVYDPHSDEEGCFGWVDKQLERLSQVSVIDGKGGEAVERGRPEPVLCASDEARDASAMPVQPGSHSGGQFVYRIGATILSHLSVFLLGFLVAWYAFPRVLMMTVPVDPKTGEIVLLPQKPDSRQQQASPKEGASPQVAGDPGGRQDTGQPGKPLLGERGKQ